MINYTVYCDGKPLYIYGDASRTVISPTLTLDVNKAGSLEFSILPVHPLFNEVHKMRSLIQVYRNGEEIWAGRPFDRSGDFRRKRKFYCEGRLAFLNDSKREPNTFSGTVEQYISRLLANHNAQMYTDAHKQFQIGVVQITGTVNYVQAEPQSTWELLKTQLLDVFGGYIRLRPENGIVYLDYLEKSGKRSRQAIEYGKNLLDLSDYTSPDGVCSVLIPYGAKNEAGKYLKIESVNDGVDYIKNDAAVDEYTRIVDFAIFKDITDPAELLEAGKAELFRRLLLASTIEASAIDLVRIGLDTDTLECGDYIPIISLPHELNAELICCKTVERLDVPNQTKYTLGTSMVSFTAKQVAAGQRATTINNAAMSAAEAADKAMQSVDNLPKTQSGRLSFIFENSEPVTQEVKFKTPFVNVPEVVLSSHKSGIDYELGEINADGFLFTAKGPEGAAAVFSWIAAR